MRADLTDDGQYLIFKNNDSRQFVKKTIEKNSLKGLFVFTDAMPVKPQSLDFLGDWTFLRNLRIASVYDFDFSFLKSLDKLERLAIHVVGTNEIDLSSQGDLRELAVKYRKGIANLDKCRNLSKLTLVEYKSSDMSLVSRLTSLEELVIKTASIRSLQGIESLLNLKKIVIQNCRSLHNVEALSKVSGLRHLEMDVCPGITNSDILSGLTNLEAIRFTNCKEINSIRFMASLPNLKKVAILGNSDIVDSDLTVLKDGIEATYRPRKHYFKNAARQ